MRALLWIAAVAAFAVWTLLAWLAYGLVELVFALLGSGVGALLGSWAAWLADAVGDLGQALVVILWLVVGLIILALPRVGGGRAGNVPDTTRAAKLLGGQPPQ